MANDTCPPCNHNCRQGRDCPARKKTLPAPTDLAAALLKDVPRFNVTVGDHTDPSVLLLETDVLAALSAHLDGVTERAGEVLEGATLGPKWEYVESVSHDGQEWCGCGVAPIGGTEFIWLEHSAERDVPIARFIAWARNNVPALLAQNAALRANTVQMLDEADREYNRKTNDMIERHAEQLAALRAERDRYLRHLTTGAESLNAYKARAEVAEAERDALLGAVKGLVEVLDQHETKGPLPDTALMFCWLAAQNVRAVLRG